MGRIIINADDYGADSQRTAGILVAALCGGVSSVSVLVTGFSDESLRLLKSFRALRKTLSIGLHVDLTSAVLVKHRSVELWEGEPVYNDKRDLWLKAVEGKLKLSVIQAELESQVNKFKTIFGDVPDHLDSHNHVHIATPQLYSLFTKIAAHHGIKNIRFPHDPFFLIDNQTALSDYSQLRWSGKSGPIFSLT